MLVPVGTCSSDPEFSPMPLLRFLLIGLIVLSPSIIFAQTTVDVAVHDNAGLPIPNASISLQHQDGAKVQETTTDANGKFRLTALEAGAYSLQVQAANYYPLHYEFVLRPRQPLSLNLDLQKKETLKESVEVRAGYLTIDPEKTGSSYTFTHQDLERLPDPIVETTSDLRSEEHTSELQSHLNLVCR